MAKSGLPELGSDQVLDGLTELGSDQVLDGLPTLGSDQVLDGLPTLGLDQVLDGLTNLLSQHHLIIMGLWNLFNHAQYFLVQTQPQPSSARSWLTDGRPLV